MKKRNLKQEKKKYKDKLEKLEAAREKKEVKHFVNSRANAIQKPEHERKKPLFILAIVLGVLANLLSGVTEYSKVFTFCYGILGSLILATLLANVVTIIFIAGLELANRFIGKSYFEQLAENEEHTSKMNGKLILMVALSGLSIFLSFGGSFDLIKLAKNPPTLSQATLNTKVGIDATYNKLVNEAGDDANKFYNSKLWKGRLSDKNMVRYNQLVNKKQSLMDAHALALQNLITDNAAEEERVQKENDKKKANHTASINNQGYGLGFITILSILGLYLCLWYEADYREKKKEYLEEKYRAQFDEEEDDEEEEKVKEIELLQNKLQQLEAIISQSQHPQNNHRPIPGPNGETNFIAQPGYYQYPNNPMQTRANRIEVKGFLSGSSTADTNLPPPTPIIPNTDVSHCDTSPNNEGFKHKQSENIKIVDINKLEKDIRTYYPRTFSRDQIGDLGTISKKSRNDNLEKVNGWIKELEQYGKGTIIDFENYKTVEFYQLKESQPA